LFLSDVFPTASWSVLHAGVKKGDTVVVLESGPVGLMTQKCAWMQDAKRVIAVDDQVYRLNHAKVTNKVQTVNFSDHAEIVECRGAYIKELTQGGADFVIDCGGLDGKMSPVQKIEQKIGLQGGTLSAIYIAKDAVRKFGPVQLTGVNAKKFPLLQSNRC
jgi:S-(hydroxymethyl)glutathione dehydrogenase/alcohol dehydrogenase